MKVQFRNIPCPGCFKANDPRRCNCVHCGADLNNPIGLKYKNQLHFPFWKELIFFLLAFIGLSVTATIIQVVQLLMIKDAYPMGTAEEWAERLSSGPYMSFTEFMAYGIVFAVGAVLIWRGWKELGLSFKGWKPYVFGIVGFVAMIGTELLYNLITGTILEAAGMKMESNANQNAIVGIVAYAPIWSLILFGLIGPFVEELAYRAGLFGLLGRVSKVLAYIGVPIIFGLIHFDFTSAFNFTTAEATVAAVNEWVNLPIYMFSGLVFCFLYDKWGFGASYVAHATNNVFSIVMSIIEINGAAS